MKTKSFLYLSIILARLKLSSCSNKEVKKTIVKEKEKEISFTNIKYLDTIQNTKPAIGIPAVDIDYWMKLVFKDIFMLRKQSKKGVTPCSSLLS